MSTSQPEAEQVERVLIQTNRQTLELTSGSHEFLLLAYQTADRQITSLVASQPLTSEKKTAKKTRQTKELVS